MKRYGLLMSLALLVGCDHRPPNEEVICLERRTELILVAQPVGKITITRLQPVTKCVRELVFVTPPGKQQ